MNKKVMALAVAGALAAPAAAFAQASNVQIYGTLSLSMEQRGASGQDTALAPAAGGSSIRGAAGAASVATPYSTATAPVATQGNRMGSQSAGSNFGVRGREDLGGGMYAGFQIEISAAPLGATPVGATTGSSILATYRNAGLWVGSSAFGEVGAGQWDSPFTMVTNNTGPMHAAYGNASTSMSAGFLGANPIAPGTISGQSIGQYCGATGAYAIVGGPSMVSCYNMGTSFNRRVANQVWYQSPNWSGFSFRAMTVASTQDYVASNTFTGNVAANVNELKPTMYGLSAQYANGPLDIRIGYESHKDMLAAALRGANGIGSAAAAITVGGVGTSAAVYNTNLTTNGGTGISGSTDNAWNINARYNMGAFSMGAYWERMKWNASYIGTAVGGGNVTNLSKTGWRLDGAWQGGPHTVGIQYGKNNNLKGSLDNANSFDGSSTSATAWIFGYAYSLSKRTNLFAYHTRISNDTNAHYAGIVFNGISTPSGADPRYTGAGIRHSF